MTNLERSQTDTEPKTWSYNTRYDVVKWPQLSTIDAASQAVQDIENYVSYINNEMPDDYMALAQITQNHNDSTWLYEMS
ncbi:hypothetical protein KC953_02880, partial [Candidatus Saccharibacteria bacterium]|nr:hypothetical protein [Candidatus Saccharibacteria bacterium]